LRSAKFVARHTVKVRIKADLRLPIKVEFPGSVLFTL
jgi:hypothetical protein